uniref:Uncharacterized protein n=1 Tax=Geospiza parvula TaxID=87175 RepID=A0A8U8CLE0_GEOPR
MPRFPCVSFNSEHSRVPQGHLSQSILEGLWMSPNTHPRKSPPGPSLLEHPRKALPVVPQHRHTESSPGVIPLYLRRPSKVPPSDVAHSRHSRKALPGSALSPQLHPSELPVPAPPARVPPVPPVPAPTGQVPALPAPAAAAAVGPVGLEAEQGRAEPVGRLARQQQPPGRGVPVAQHGVQEGQQTLPSPQYFLVLTLAADWSGRQQRARAAPAGPIPLRRFPLTSSHPANPRLAALSESVPSGQSGALRREPRLHNNRGAWSSERRRRRVRTGILVLSETPAHGPQHQAAACRPATRHGQGSAWELPGGHQTGEGRIGAGGRREAGGGAGEEEGLAQGQEEEEDPSQWPQSPRDGLRALPERAARADPHAASRPALPRDHKDAGSRVEQTAALREAAVPGRGRAGEAAVHEGAAGVPAVRGLQNVHREDPGEKDQKRGRGHGGCEHPTQRAPTQGW